ncbi:MAG: SpoIIE family protein phosphatase [Holophagales bacterium]|nr:SpoIIE family protein phosphatase [Holophagales bacterium]MBK9967082.1 SpoIIE family protein phosphatase [Holophagales bacterium]
MTESIAGATILVVDDTAVNRRILRAILERAGAVVSEAPGGEEALRLVRAAPPDLLLLDVMMPGMDGLQVCAALKSDPTTSDVPIIVVSSLGETADRIRGLSAGAEDYVTKPFDAGEVLARVATHLRIRRLTRSLRELNRELTDRQQRIDDDLRAAAEIQRTLLPRTGAAAPRLAFEWLFEPCATIGGDIFDVVSLGAGRTAIYVLDVSGHGVPAALVTVSVSQSLAPMSGIILDARGEPSPPSEVLARLDAEYPFERFDMFFTMAYLTFDAATGVLRYASAGHPPPLLLRPGKRPQPLEEGGTIVGLGVGTTFDEGSVVLAPGDRLALCTDGVLETASPAGELFGGERLDDVLVKGAGLALSGLRDLIGREVSVYGAGLPARDDVSLLLVEVLV